MNHVSASRATGLVPLAVYGAATVLLVVAGVLGATVHVRVQACGGVQTVPTGAAFWLALLAAAAAGGGAVASVVSGVGRCQPVSRTVGLALLGVLLMAIGAVVAFAVAFAGLCFYP